MANLDTRKKRASCVQLVKPYCLAIPLPTGNITDQDRAHIAWCYGATLLNINYTATLNIYAVPSESRVIAVPVENRVMVVHNA